VADPSPSTTPQLNSGGGVTQSGEIKNARNSLSREVLEVCLQITTIFNLFITYGDQFANPNDYDELYYELIRNEEDVEMFCNIIDFCEAEGEVRRLLWQHVENFRSILVHFSTKLDYYASSQGHTSLTPDQVVTVIKANYGTLKLNLLENLAVLFPHRENPHELAFFKSYLRSMIVSSRYAVTLPSVRFAFEKHP